MEWNIVRLELPGTGYNLLDLKRIIFLFIFIVGLTLAILIPSVREGWGENDFLRYWTASKILMKGGNPYDANELLQLQATIRPHLAEQVGVVQAWNPPWLMLLFSPLTLFNLSIATRLWIFTSTSLTILALYLLWEMVFEPSDRKGLILTLGAGFLYSNTMSMVYLGQISSLLLIGLVFFIWCLDRKYYLWAGVGLLLLTIKPHITYLVLLVIFIWVIRQRRWRVIIGLLMSALISMIIVWLIFPGWLSAYIETLFTLPYTQLYTSTLGSFFESVLGVGFIKYIGLLLIPLAFPLARYVDKAGWLTALNLALIISIPLAPYGFNFDHVLLLPAVVQMISWIRNKELPTNYAWAIGLGLVIDYLLVVYMTNLAGEIPYYWYVWPSILLAVIFIVGWMKRNEYQLQTI